MTGLIALMLAGAATTADVAPARGPTPLGNPGQWVATQDYPPDALRQGSEGAVGFRLEVSPQGTVSGCAITASSGVPALDEATCRLIAQRARFTPARDASGAAIAGSFASRVRWVLPKNVPKPEAMNLETTAVVETDGRITDCRVVTAEGAAAAPGRLRSPCERQQRTEPFLDAAGRPVRKLVRTRQSVIIEDAR